MKKFLFLILVAAIVLFAAGCADDSTTTDLTDDAAGPSGTENAESETPAETEPPVEPAIEVSEFCEPEDMPEAELSEFESDDYAITVGDRTFSLGWLYEHNIYDWRQAGITYDQIDEKTGSYLALPFSEEALEKFKQKISDFTMLIMLQPSAEGFADTPSITVDDDVYDIEWLSSHNATEYTEAGIDAGTVSQYLEALAENYWYTREYRWIEIVHDRLVNGF